MKKDMICFKTSFQGDEKQSKRKNINCYSQFYDNVKYQYTVKMSADVSYSQNTEEWHLQSYRTHTFIAQISFAPAKLKFLEKISRQIRVHKMGLK